MEKPVPVARLGLWLGVWGVSAVAVAQVPSPEAGYGPGYGPGYGQGYGPGYGQGYGPSYGPRAWGERAAPSPTGRWAATPGSPYAGHGERAWAPTAPAAAAA